jgi:hypothetical protein
MPNQSQVFVLGSDGNLWFEQGPFGNVAQTIRTRQQVDGSVTNLYSQVGENRIWRPSFQAISATEIFVLGTDGNLWQEFGGKTWTVPLTIANRSQVDSSVETFQVLDTNTVFVLGTDGNLWLETGPFGNVSQTVANRKQVDGSVLAFQALDVNTVFVLGTDGNLWLETGPFGNVSESNSRRLQVDGSVIQFWAMSLGEVYVLGSDLNLWYEPGPFGNLNITQSNRTQIDANVNDFQGLRLSSEAGSSINGSSADVIFILGHDGNLWMVQGPYNGVAHTVATRQFVEENVISFGALNTSEMYLIDGNLNLWYETTPFGSQNRQQVDGNAVACQPLYSESLFAKHGRHPFARAKMLQKMGANVPTKERV